MGCFGVWLEWQGWCETRAPLCPGQLSSFPSVALSGSLRAPGGQASAGGEAILPASLSSAGLAHHGLPHRARLCKDIAASVPAGRYLLSRPVPTDEEGV